WAAVKAMVASWPWPCLNLASLMSNMQPSGPTVMLNVFRMLEVLVDQGPRHAAGQLSVLWPTAPVEEAEPEYSVSFEDLQETDPTYGFWRREDFYSSTPCQPPLADVKLVGDLSFQETEWNALLTFLTWRVKQVKVLPLICCQNLSFSDDLPGHRVIQKILENVQLDGVKELRIHHTLKRNLLSLLAPYLCRMVNLNTLELQSLTARDWTLTQRSLDKERAKKLGSIFTEFTSQLTHLRQLQHLLLIDLYVCGNIHRFLRYLETPLESLTISTFYFFVENSDLESLSLYPCTSRLRALNFSSTNLASLNPELLRVAIDRTSATLERLDLSDCRLKDSHLDTI
ncbi:PREDICTED: melanoma antigen preferentially expressed in tumors-like, partial [Elephantulus edwardii]|uniref:melanoma antigen preferentially expressed in tumors-like n=1 Tax=Elephantulus edwardii TaxID=28737 RepID=UPI0003F0F2CD